MIGVSDTLGDVAEWTFPGAPGAVRAARHAVRDTLRSWDLDGLSDVTELLVSELVTNSLRYASGPIGVRLARLRVDGVSRDGVSRDGVSRDGARPGGGAPASRSALLVEVSDPLPDPPLERPAGPDDEGGRGIKLVACTARRWGTRRGRAGKTVWFELPLPG
ncbi:ATP-binding protein [Streptomyces sp. SCSIO 30461]|uniref:ATP-binding protein n=1 Tax=Streptomyces sp. SCSIO 30461 TaxID=3118085 RepID=UPI0030CAD35C